MKKRPKVGVAVIVIKSKKVLIGHRRNTGIGRGVWGFPGGHLEFNEEIFDCAIREVTEETGIKIHNLRIGPYTNDFYTKENKHYITLFVIADYKSGEPKVLEPKKCRAWGWFSWDNLPSPLFLPIQNLRKQKFSPFT